MYNTKKQRQSLGRAAAAPGSELRPRSSSPQMVLLKSKLQSLKICVLRSHFQDLILSPLQPGAPAPLCLECFGNWDAVCPAELRYQDSFNVSPSASLCPPSP